MSLNHKLLDDARAARDQLRLREEQTASARTDYEMAVVGLHKAGGTMREIAAALEVSHQRVHQIVNAARVHCSFCGLAQAQVKKLIAGPRVYICDRCVQQARARHTGWEIGGAPGRRCSFCGRKAERVKALAQKRGRRVCDECLDLSDAIVAETVGES